jgi:protein gp37
MSDRSPTARSETKKNDAQYYCNRESLRGATISRSSSIEWTESTWNPTTGCDKVSPGCKNCYAERMARRLKGMGQANYRNGFEITLRPQALALPLSWKRPQMIFVDSMSDLWEVLK